MTQTAMMKVAGTSPDGPSATGARRRGPPGGSEEELSPVRGPHSCPGRRTRGATEHVVRPMEHPGTEGNSELENTAVGGFFPFLFL